MINEHKHVVGTDADDNEDGDQVEEREERQSEDADIRRECDAPISTSNVGQSDVAGLCEFGYGL